MHMSLLLSVENKSRDLESIYGITIQNIAIRNENPSSGIPKSLTRITGIQGLRIEEFRD